ncbi:MAG: hypothetical protein AAGG69_06030, partial [Pseudomonadota bacterium]
ASDERLTQAAVPSLVIVAFGILPVIILCRTIAMERPTHHSEMENASGSASSSNKPNVQPAE